MRRETTFLIELVAAAALGWALGQISVDRFLSHNQVAVAASSAVVVKTLDNAICSGTSIGPAAVLTATHCEDVDTLNGVVVPVDRKVHDGNDHSILFLREPMFSNWVSVDQSVLQIGDRFVMVGNPRRISRVMRHGTVGAIEEIDDVKYIVLDCNGGHGDSGAGIISENGKLIATITDVVIRDEITLMLARPLNFTERQLREAKSYRGESWVHQIGRQLRWC